MVAPALSKSYSTVGTAVDYLLRGKVEFLNPGRTHTKQDLVGDYSYALLAIHLKRRGRALVPLGRKFRMILPANVVLDRINLDYEKARASLLSYGHHGVLTDEVIAAALFFARLDPYYRALVIDPGLMAPDAQAYDDVRAILSHVPPEYFTASKQCFLNPHFGAASEMVFGADADLIIDDLLLEIKTTKDLCVRREHLDQLLCYYILHKIGGVNDQPRARPIKRIGVYFSRHALLWSIPIKDLAPQRSLSNFKNWFEDRYGNF